MVEKLRPLHPQLLGSENGQGKGLRRVRLRCETWLSDVDKQRVMSQFSVAWGLCIGKCTCAVGENGSGKQDGYEKRWPRIEWCFDGEKATIARKEWKVIPRLSAGAWTLALRRTPLHLDIQYIVGAVSDGSEVSDEGKYLIKRFKRRGWLDPDNDRDEREEAVKRLPGSGWTFMCQPKWTNLEILFGIAATAEVEEAEEEKIREQRAFKELRNVQQAKMRAKRRNART
ncbi:hypothetical protein ACEPPN_016256 [Leptodophora sp. 'Broadleaf-Isolate-01']